MKYNINHKYDLTHLALMWAMALLFVPPVCMFLAAGWIYFNG